jgi:predicted ATPase/DNA-binding CsgD family transcriptional regulator
VEATSFVGRRREVAEIKRKLGSARLVTLVGPGGVGKTRLAVRAATELGRGFAEGPWLVELADVGNPALVSNAMAAALDLRDQTATEPLAILVSYLRGRQMLLVVDNCEHLLEATAHLLSEVIRSAPGVRVMATSREPLSMAGEHIVPVPPLELPSAEASEPLVDVRRNESVALFLERAAAAGGSFELTVANQASVVRLCRRLDGLPLAIELAAVRTRVLGVDQILDRLSDRFALLTSGGHAALPRQQTLRTTIDWSHDLLTEDERRLLRRLCVFAGRFTLEDAEAVGATDQAVELISSLVDRSLLVKEDRMGQACFRLHETMRDYAALKLRDAGEESATVDRCAAYFRMRCLQAAPQARYRLVSWLEWMDLEIDNVRAVLRGLADRREYGAAIDIAVGTGWFWITRATTEGARWFDELLAADAGDVETLAWAYFLRGFLAVLQSQPATARPAIGRAIEIARNSSQADVVAEALCMASIVASMEGDRAAAERFLDEAQLAARGLHEPSIPLSLLQTRTLAGFLSGDLEAVRRAAEEGVRLSRDVSDLYALEMMSMNLGYVELMLGELRSASPRFVEALKIARQIDDRVAQYALLYALGFIAAEGRQNRVAAQLLGGADAVRDSAGATVIAYLNPLIAQAQETLVAALGTSRFEAEVEAGRRMGRLEVVGLALGEGLPAAEAVSANGAQVGPLARREVEVARLVADGLSNKAIGTRLFISERTVDSHVRSILNKLGFNSRAQIAAWMAGANQ